MQKLKGKKITIVGLGLMGGSIAKSLKKANISHVYGLDIDKSVLTSALKDTVIKAGYTQASDILPTTDFLIICLYPKAAIKFLEENHTLMKSGSVVCDICGVKSLVVDNIPQQMLKKVDFVPTHPMAGRELMGYSESIDNLFDGCNYIITPLTSNKPSSIELIEDFATTVGAKSIIKCDANTHDEYISFVSQLPHVLAVAYMKASHKRPLGGFAGGSFRDVSRVALINEIIWQELFDHNKDKLVPEIDNLINELSMLKDYIKNNDKPDVLHYLADGRKIKENYDEINKNK